MKDYRVTLRMRNLLPVILLLISLQAFSQDTSNSFNYSRNNITLNGMKVLCSWGIANLGVGAAGWATADNISNKYFYQMSTLWGAVNTGLSVLAISGAKRNLHKIPDNSENLKAQRIIENTFLINGGLDFVYIGAGIYLSSRGNSRGDAKLKGYGSSVTMQGVFLLVFDAVMYKVHKSNGNKMRGIFEKNTITFNGNAVGMVHSF